MREQHDGATGRFEQYTEVSAYEINTNGGNVGFCVGVIGKSEKQTRLSDTGVSDKE